MAQEAPDLEAVLASPSRLVDEHVAAEILSLSVRTLRNWRSLGQGPRVRRLGRRAIRYRVGDLLEFAGESPRRQGRGDR